MKYYAAILLMMLFTSHVSAHNDEAYNHNDKLPENNIKWMSQLSQDRKINELSIPGTHDSVSFYGGDAVKTQSVSMTGQLKAGVRFFDIRLRHIDNVFAIHHGSVFQNQFFGDILNQARDFIRQNPSEFILMRVKEEYDAEKVTQTFTQTFIDYSKKYSDVIYHPAANNGFPTVKDVRGKIVFLIDFKVDCKSSDCDTSVLPLGINYSLFDIQDDYHVKTNWDLYDKWKKVKRYLDESNKREKTSTINYLSASGGSFPYFIASGHSSPGNGAPRLSTGLTTPGFKSRYPDFPRVSCFIGICTIAFEGTNILSRNWISSNKPTYTGIVVADFIGIGLIDAVIKSNFR